MPARSVQKHQDVLCKMTAGDLHQIEGHGERVGVGQHQADQFAVLRAHAAKDVRVFTHPVRGYFGSATRRRPTADGITHAPEARFILKHQAQRALRVPSRHGVHFGLKFF